jgi:hypothetical protein
MPKKLKPESEADQGERFRREAQKLIDAGELDANEAEKKLRDLLRSKTETPPG